MESAKRLEIALEHLVREGHTDEQLQALFVLTVTVLRKRLPKEAGGSVVNMEARAQGVGAAVAGKRRMVGTLTVTTPQGEHSDE